MRVPLCKVLEHTSFNEPRPIIILPVLSKVMKEAVDCQLREQVNKYNILPRCQCGFRPIFSYSINTLLQTKIYYTWLTMTDVYFVC